MYEIIKRIISLMLGLGGFYLLYNGVVNGAETSLSFGLFLYWLGIGTGIFGLGVGAMALLFIVKLGPDKNKWEKSDEANLQTQLNAINPLDPITIVVWALQLYTCYFMITHDLLALSICYAFVKLVGYTFVSIMYFVLKELKRGILCIRLN